MSDSHPEDSSTDDRSPTGVDSSRATELIVAASRFVRAASRYSGRERSTIVLRTLSNLSIAGPMRLGDLAVAEHISQPTMTGVVKRLVDEGLLRREGDPCDGRVQLIDITPSGRVALEAFRQKAAERVRPALERLTDDERRVLWQASQILDSINSELDDF